MASFTAEHVLSTEVTYVTRHLALPSQQGRCGFLIFTVVVAMPVIDWIQLIPCHCEDITSFMFFKLTAFDYAIFACIGFGVLTDGCRGSHGWLKGFALNEQRRCDSDCEGAGEVKPAVSFFGGSCVILFLLTMILNHTTSRIEFMEAKG